MSDFLKTQGLSDFLKTLIISCVDDFIISCAHRPTLDIFRDVLLTRFDGTTDGVIQTYLGCEIDRDMSGGTTTLSKKQYAEDILRTYRFWGFLPLATMLPRTLAFLKTVGDPAPELVKE